MKKLSIVTVIIAGVLWGLTAQYAVAKDKTPLEEVTVTGMLEKKVISEGPPEKATYWLHDKTNDDRVKIPKVREVGINLEDYCDKKVTVVGMGYQSERTRGKRKGKMETKIKTVTSIQEVTEE